MNNDTIILSMTSWPPRFSSVVAAMSAIVDQKKTLEDKVHCVLVLSEEECNATLSRKAAYNIMHAMEGMGVEVIIDRGNIRSHKKLIPTICKYPNNPILVIDDDILPQKGWLQTFVKDHEANRSDIIYGMSRSRIVVNENVIHEDRARLIYSTPGQRSIDLKPANGASGTLYPARTFVDDRFFDRKLFMKVSPTSDETWQFAFAIITQASFRCLSAHNIPYPFDARQDCALFNTNVHLYDKIHNDIAAVIPEYLEALKKNCKT